MTIISPSLLSADFTKLNEEIKAIENTKATWLHYDVMDGHFVPNISFGYGILQNVSKVTNLFLDVHLMISDPLFYANEFIKAKANMITFHLEAFSRKEDVQKMIDLLHENNVKAGLAIRPFTPIEAVLPYIETLDMVLVMSVEPGFGGQSFKEEAVEKITKLDAYRKQHKLSYLIQVDGGINATTGKLCKDAGCDVLVAGSYIFNSDDYDSKVDSLL